MRRRGPVPYIRAYNEGHLTYWEVDLQLKIEELLWFTEWKKQNPLSQRRQA